MLGGQTVTNAGATTLTGNLGVSPGSAITGKETITINGMNAADAGNPSVHENDAFAILAQSQLAAARTILGLLGPGTMVPAGNLGGLTLFPGVYTVPANTTNLSGTLTLDGLGDADAAWVFQMPSTLITSPGAVVNLINTDPEAAVYWNVASSVTLDTTTSFQGLVLALTSISLNHAATIWCGSALAQNGAVTMDNNTVNSTGCTGMREIGDISAGQFSPVPVPVPGALLLLATGVGSLFGLGRLRRRAVAAA